jgi:hypothetical protein
MRFSADMLQQSLLKDLSAHIDVNLPSWSVDCSPQQVACYRLKESLVKKLNQADTPSELASDAALKKFLAVNQRLSTWELSVNTVQPDWELLSMLREELKEFLDPSNLGPIYSDYTLMFQKGYAGPGASIGALGCDFYTKMFASKLSTTESVSDVWSTLMRFNPQFGRAYGDPSSGVAQRVVDHNKLSFVNKNQDIARSICTEPTINMWLQLGMGNILQERLLKVYGIDFKVQPEVNRRLARLGSLLDHNVTIDLESASDSLGLRMMEEVFPKGFMGMLRRLRSPVSQLPDGSRVPLNMVSTMGNGFTFPLQTLLFAASCVVVLRYLSVPVINKGAWSVRTMSVFGDDIIIDKRCSRLLIHLLKMLGFVVNEDKTFVEGPFRESCGVDWFLGHDVRPVYLKRLLTLQDSFVIVNKLNLWSAKTGVSLRNTVSYVLACFPRARTCLVPPDEDDASGIKVPRELCGVSSRSVRSSFGLLRYVASVPVTTGYQVDDDNCRLLGHPRKCEYNPEGMLVAILGGYVTGYRRSSKSGGGDFTPPKVSVRQTVTRYKTKRRHTPSWGYLRPDCLAGYPDRYQRFTTAVNGNL